ncbi:ferritin-like domain-containing protein [Anaerolineales bacterium]
MKINDLTDVFHEQLKDMYSAEKQIIEALPEMINAASSSELKKAFEDHLKVTKTQLEGVKEILSDLGVNPGKTHCKAMEGILKEATDMAKMDGDVNARDAGLICMAQKVEHYEIATYGSLCSWAKELGEDEIANKLQTILDQEYDADNKLDKLAESRLNERAKS